MGEHWQACTQAGKGLLKVFANPCCALLPLAASREGAVWASIGRLVRRQAGEGLLKVFANPCCVLLPLAA